MSPFLFPLTCCPWARQLISNNSIRAAQWCNSSRLWLYLAAPSCECVKRGIADEHAQCVPSGCVQVFKDACQVEVIIWGLVQLSPEAAFWWNGSTALFFTCLDRKLELNLYLVGSTESWEGIHLSFARAGSILATTSPLVLCGYLTVASNGRRCPNLHPGSPRFKTTTSTKTTSHGDAGLFTSRWCWCWETGQWASMCVGKVWGCRKMRRRDRNVSKGSLGF